MQAILSVENENVLDTIVEFRREDLGRKVGIIASLFGCWHKDLGRPFNLKDQAYRACTDCGARRKFDTNTFITSGPFYYPPSV